MKNDKKRILIVAAHPDDELLGCGGTIGRLISEGNAAYALILGEGVTSRKYADKNRRQEDFIKLKNEAKKADKILGIKDVYFSDFPDNSFDSVPFLSIVKSIEEIKNRIKPDIIFTHFEKDLNIDHQITYKGVITAARPVKGETVREIYSFEILSSTEWSYPVSFSPDVFFDISEYMDMKIKAAVCYKSEMREYPHPRSLKGIKLTAQHWGMKIGLDYVEAFKTVRIVK